MEPAEVSRHRGYYCHKCNATISLPPSARSCPHCNDDFIERLPDGPSGASSFTDRNNELRDDSNSIPMVLNRAINDFNNFEVIIHGGEPNQGTASGNRPSSSHRHETSSDPTRPNDRRRVRNQNYTGTFEHILSEFLNTMSRPNAGNSDNNSPVFFVSNYGDYAWGREGLDTIVTQLLNQMDSSGPPPLAKDKIKELPYVLITEQQASENIQCSVCWDSFKMSENVRQLPCEHIYHDLCIVPWLELHGTCPICRKVLCEDNDARLGFSHSGGLEALLSDVHSFNIPQSISVIPNASSTQRRNIQCFRCHNFGHIARYCPEPSYQHGDTWSDYDDNDFDDDYEDSVIDFEDYDSDMNDFVMSESLYRVCNLCEMPFGGHLADCSRKDELEFNGWENAVSFSGGSSSSATYGRGQSSSDDHIRFRKRKNAIRCYNCNQLGHIARECRNTQPKDRCVHCKPPNQANDTFPNRSGRNNWSENNRCWRKKDSPPQNRTNSNFGGPSTSRFQSQGRNERRNVTCYNCKQVGHLARDCSSSSSSFIRRRNKVCRGCGQSGHTDTECWYSGPLE